MILWKNVFLLLRGLGILVQTIMLIKFIVHLIVGGDTMNMWSAIVCIIAIIFMFVTIIVGFNFGYKKYKLYMEDKDKERRANEKLNIILIENNLIRKNCNPIPLSDTSDNSKTQESISNSDINDAAKNIIDLASTASTAFRKKEWRI